MTYQIEYTKKPILYIGSSISFWEYEGKYYLANPSDVFWLQKHKIGEDVPNQLKEVEQEMFKLCRVAMLPKRPSPISTYTSDICQRSKHSRVLQQGWLKKRAVESLPHRDVTMFVSSLMRCN